MKTHIHTNLMTSLTFQNMKKRSNWSDSDCISRDLKQVGPMKVPKWGKLNMGHGRYSQVLAHSYTTPDLRTWTWKRKNHCLISFFIANVVQSFKYLWWLGKRNSVIQTVCLFPSGRLESIRGRNRTFSADIQLAGPSRVSGLYNFELWLSMGPVNITAVIILVVWIIPYDSHRMIHHHQWPTIILYVHVPDKIGFSYFEEGLGLGFSDFVPIDATSTYSTNGAELLNLLSYPPSKHNNLSN